MINLNFLTESIHLNVGFGSEVSANNQMRISYKVHLELRAELNLATEESFNNLRGFLTVSSGNPSKINESTIGTLDFAVGRIADEHDDGYSSSYFISANVPQSVFDELLSSARAGYLPSCISVWVLGMKYNSVGEIKWDNITLPTLNVSSISFSIPMCHSINEE